MRMETKGNMAQGLTGLPRVFEDRCAEDLCAEGCDIWAHEVADIYI